MYHGSYNNPQGQYQGNPNNPPPPHPQQHQQQTDAYGQQVPPPPQQQYYQAQQPQQAQQQQTQQYGSQPTNNPPHSVYPQQQQQLGYTQQTHVAATGGGGTGYGHSSAATVAGQGVPHDAYASYGPTHQQQHYSGTYPTQPSSLHHQQQQQQQQHGQGTQQTAPYYTQQIAPPPPPAAAAVAPAVVGSLPHQQYSHQHQQQTSYQPPPPPLGHHHPQQQQQQPQQPPQYQQQNMYAEQQPNINASTYYGAPGISGNAVPPAPMQPAQQMQPMQRVVEETQYNIQHHQYQQHSVQGYDQGYGKVQGQGQGHAYPPPAPHAATGGVVAATAAAAPPLAFPPNQLLPQQTQQYSRYEPKNRSRIGNRERGGGPIGQHTSETRKAYSSAGGSGGGGGGPQKKKSKKSGGTGTGTGTGAGTTRGHEKHNQYTHRSSRSPAPTDSQIRLSPAANLTTAATDSDYAVHLPAYQLRATPSMDYMEVSRRFERLIMPEDFIEVIRPQQLVLLEQQTQSISTISNSDINGLGLSKVLNLNGSLPVHHEICTEKVDTSKKKHPLAGYDPDPLLTSPLPPPPPPAAATVPATILSSFSSSFSSSADLLPVVYNAKVVLLSGLNKDDQDAILSSSSGSETTIKKDFADHISCRLKFIVARAERAGIKSGIFSLGGRCDPSLDGNPEIDGEKALIHAATRHALIQTGVDLSGCRRWFKILEIKYHRLTATDPAVDAATTTKNTTTTTNTAESMIGGGYIEKTSIFLIDDGVCAVPALEDWPDAWEKRHTQPRILAEKYSNGDDQQMVVLEDEEIKEEGKVEKTDDGGAGGDDGSLKIQIKKEKNNSEDCEEGELPETASPLFKSTIPPTKKKGALSTNTAKIEKMPVDPRLLFIGLATKNLRIKTMSISLDGLLDYNESDIEEATFEMSLFAETMHEMFSRDAGETMLKALTQKPWKKVGKINVGGDATTAGGGGGMSEGKRKKEIKGEESQPPVKKRKSGEEKKEEDEEEEEETQVPNFIAFNEEEEDEEGNAEKNEEEEGATIVNTLKEEEMEKQEEEEKEMLLKSNNIILLQQALFAFNYFDAGGLGYILTEDLQLIIESLGLHVHHGVVRELCHAAAEASMRSGGSGDGKVEYRKLCCSAGGNTST